MFSSQLIIAFQYINQTIFTIQKDLLQLIYFKIIYRLIHFDDLNYLQTPAFNSFDFINISFQINQNYLQTFIPLPMQHQQYQYQPQKMEIEAQPCSQANQHLNQNQFNHNQQEKVQFQQINQQQYQKYAQDVQQNSKRIIKKVTESNNQSNQQDEEHIQPVKNPVSAYLIFTMKWKQDNPNKKFSMSLLGQLWKNLLPHQKRQFEQQYRRRKQKYDLYVASKLIKNPNTQKQQDIENKYFFPLHRIKAIMKQDKFYAPKTQAVTAMARATQYFGQYFLEQVKKITQGKNRIDTKDLFECISVNQRIFGFLDCLIDDYALSSKQKKPVRMNNQQQVKQKYTPLKEHVLSQKKKTVNQNNTFSNSKPLPKGQIKITDMFGGLNSHK